MVSSTHSNTMFVVSKNLCSSHSGERNQPSNTETPLDTKTSVPLKKVGSPKVKMAGKESASMSRWEFEGKDEAPWSAINIDENGEPQKSVRGRKDENEWAEVSSQSDTERSGVGEGNIFGSWHHEFAGTFLGIGAEELVGVGKQFEE